MKGDVKKNRKKAQAANAGRRRKKRRGKRTLHYILLLIFILAAGAVLCLNVFFKIESVSVIGTDKYDPVEIAENTGIEIGDNLFRIPKKEIEEKLYGMYPYIETMQIHRKIPDRVEIQIIQSVPVGAVKEGEEAYVLFTREGKVLERGLIYIPEDIPLIKGIDTTGTEPGEYLGAWEKEPAGEEETKEEKEERLARDKLKAEKADRIKEKVVMLEYLFAAIEQCGFDRVTNVDVTDRLDMQVMYENRLLLRLGSEADLTYKLDFIKEVIDDRLEPDARGTLNAAEAKNKRVSFLPADDYVLPDNPDGDLQVDPLEGLVVRSG